MERYCLTGQSPQRAVAPTEEEEELRRCTLQRAFGTGPVYYLPFLLSVYLHLILLTSANSSQRKRIHGLDMNGSQKSVYEMHPILIT